MRLILRCSLILIPRHWNWSQKTKTDRTNSVFTGKHTQVERRKLDRVSTLVTNSLLLTANDTQRYVPSAECTDSDCLERNPGYGWWDGEIGSRVMTIEVSFGSKERRGLSELVRNCVCASFENIKRNDKRKQKASVTGTVSQQDIDASADSLIWTVLLSRLSWSTGRSFELSRESFLECSMSTLLADCRSFPAFLLL
jgi:hypothetical protein